MSFSKKNVKKLVKIAVTLFFFLISGLAISNIGCSNNQNKTYIAAAEIVSSEMMKEDFEYIVKKLRNVHPATVEGFTENQEKIIVGIQEKIQQPSTKENFFFLVNKLFHSFHDAHTTQWLVFSQGINLPLIWLQNGLYIERDTDLLKYGDLIQSIGGQKVPQLFNQLNQILWTENNHLVRLEGPWMLSARPYLQHMGLIKKNSVEVTCQRAERKYTVRLPIIELERPEKEERPFITYAVDKKHPLAVLTLNSCRYNAEYRKKLREFFKEIYAQKIDNIVLDLRHNAGGDSRVIDEFLRYIDVDRFKTYGSTVRYSQDSRDKTKVKKFGLEEFPRFEKINRKIYQKELRFSGRLFALTSPNTFSSANMFTAVIQDNLIGTIVGEPTGNQPSCYGHPLSFQMPRTGIYFKISHKQFFRPEPTYDGKDAIYPDVEVYRQIDDVIKNKDTQLEKIIALIKIKQNN